MEERLQAQLEQLEALLRLEGGEFTLRARHYLEERQAQNQADRVALRRMADAYNSATPEEQALPFGQWWQNYRQSQGEGPV